ncbi:ShlB/FhaC/HecB family hemolysin secretion/activation protein [Falsiroseomonas sp. HW251]|uniref:ShlB/FhaC/HecB family hemolysin secretion/activation protein n=1 Tax=Falsiroseomonas sp. HW251 TaxID=3390998 RepID=UPI003D3226A7
MRPVLLLLAALAWPLAARAQASVEMHGVTLYDQAALLSYADAVARQEAAPDLAATARVIEQLYHEDGWFLARAWAFRDPVSGRQGIAVNEGGVRRIEVTGVEERAGNRIAAYLAPVMDGTPLRLDAYERALMLAGDLAGISLRSEFVPDPATGEYRSVIHAQQRRYAVSALVDNVPRASAVDAFVSGEAYSLLTTGDLARVVVGGTSATDATKPGFNGAAFYRVPIGNDGLYAEAFASNLVYTRDFDGTQTERRNQRGEFYGAVLGYPVLRRIDQSLYLMLEADHRAIDVDGAEFTTDRSSALRVSAYYTSNDVQAPAFRLGLTLSFGDAYSASNTNVSPTFWHLRAVAGAVFRLGEPGQGWALRLEGYAKYSPDTLTETERMYLGDRERMRGYALGTATGDTGAIGTIELSRYIPVERGILQSVTPSVFLDAGTVRKNSPYPAAPGTVLPGTLGERTVSLASVGVAWRAILDRGFALSGWVGLPLSDDGTGVQYSPAAYVRLTKAW